MEYKIVIILFILFLVIQNELFIEHVLAKFNGTLNSYGNVTKYGNIIQAILLVITYSVVMFLINHQLM